MFILRDLKKIYDQTGHKWLKDLKELLLFFERKSKISSFDITNTLRKKLIENEEKISTEFQDKFLKKFNKIMT
jgi:hypothetical protein